MGTNLKSNQDFHNSIDFTSNISSTSSLSPNNNMSKSRPEEYELIEKNIITSQGVEELFDKVLKLVQPQQRKLSMSMSMSLSPSLSASIARNKPFLQKSSLSSPSSLLSAPTEIDFQCYGLFAQSNISLGNFIAEYKGEVCLKSDYKDNPTNGYKDLGTTKPYVLFYPTLDLCVDARRYGTYARFVRRSCNPNAETRTMYINDGIVKDRQLHLGIFAKCDIMQNQEITVGWNWDNQHVAHIFIRKDGGGDVGGKGRDNDDLDQVIDLNKRIQMGTVVYNLLKFTECACEDKNNCVIEKMKNYAKKPKDDLTKNKEGYYFDPQQSNNPYNKRKIQVSSYADNNKNNDDNDQDEEIEIEEGSKESEVVKSMELDYVDRNEYNNRSEMKGINIDDDKKSKGLDNSSSHNNYNKIIDLEHDTGAMHSQSSTIVTTTTPTTAINSGRKSRYVSFSSQFPYSTNPNQSKPNADAKSEISSLIDKNEEYSSKLDFKPSSKRRKLSPTREPVLFPSNLSSIENKYMEIVKDHQPQQSNISKTSSSPSTLSTNIDIRNQSTTSSPASYTNNNDDDDDKLNLKNTQLDSFKHTQINLSKPSPKTTSSSLHLDTTTKISNILSSSKSPILTSPTVTTSIPEISKNTSSTLSPSFAVNNNDGTIVIITTLSTNIDIRNQSTTSSPASYTNNNDDDDDKLNLKNTQLDSFKHTQINLSKPSPKTTSSSLHLDTTTKISNILSSSKSPILTSPTVTTSIPEISKNTSSTLSPSSQYHTNKTFNPTIKALPSTITTAPSSSSCRHLETLKTTNTSHLNIYPNKSPSINTNISKNLQSDFTKSQETTTKPNITINATTNNNITSSTAKTQSTESKKKTLSLSEYKQMKVLTGSSLTSKTEESKKPLIESQSNNTPSPDSQIVAMTNDGYFPVDFNIDLPITSSHISKSKDYLPTSYEYHTSKDIDSINQTEYRRSSSSSSSKPPLISPRGIPPPRSYHNGGGGSGSGSSHYRVGKSSSGGHFRGMPTSPGERGGGGRYHGGLGNFNSPDSSPVTQRQNPDGQPILSSTTNNDRDQIQSIDNSDYMRSIDVRDRGWGTHDRTREWREREREREECGKRNEDYRLQRFPGDDYRRNRR
ncbi:6375_t:CDS:10 [Entrophospora sp. SA101]|nr:6375_t:CDS:10 [Entrophospora sp. SA101]